MRRENYVQNGMKLELATQLARYDEGEQHKVDLDLVTVCVRTILESYEHDLGAILIFMPGTWEINTCCRNIEKRFGRDYDLWVLPLHSSLSTKNQKQVNTTGYFVLPRINICVFLRRKANNLLSTIYYIRI